ncbi:MAG: hypothetical protein HOG49_41420, partial [Candidatus Scalindua sp.]|nr:hypothetical protein [Candidatus Scalindua sp.]
MKIKLISTIMCVMAIAIVTSGCLTTTQKGAAIGTGAGAALGTGFGALAGSASTGAMIGAGVGALGGALTGDYMDKKREEAEYAQMQRQLYMER